ncbi:hypothetical protein Pan189_12290 [Stratiformator vulcanicus]|uniref:Uncharacterized protein n=1 Tax=Stratiformator vulcanicus TaxID=2527980 RepID=A0A517QYY3_9PLAN|nr:hypothetical protein Pan189_12290 [Stratiformator vulcanicus]
MIPNNVRRLFGMKLVEVGRAADAATATIEYVRVDHCRPNVARIFDKGAKEFLHGSDIVTGFDQVRRERVPECVGDHTVRDITPNGCCANCLRRRWPGRFSAGCRKARDVVREPPGVFETD